MLSSASGFECDLSGKTALVTGASRGLGRHFAQLLHRQGAQLVIAARSGEELNNAAESIATVGGPAILPVILDVADANQVVEAMAKIKRELAIVDLLVNNAGVAETQYALELEPQAWNRQLTTNLTGAWWLSQAVARQLVASNRPGRIINVASILGIRVAGAVAAYAASKAALIQLTKSLALEWARYRINVNALAPGYIKTELNREFFASPAGARKIAQIPQQRLGEPQDLDGPFLLLASELSNYMTGSVLVVDGGHLHSAL